MKKVLKFFPINKLIQKKNIKSLLAAAGVYVVIFLALIVVKKIFLSVFFLGELAYNVLNLYKVYAFVGVILGAITYFTGIDNNDISYITLDDIKKIYLSDKKILIWIATVVLIAGLSFVTPMGLREARVMRKVDKYIAEDHSNDVIEEKVEEKTPIDSTEEKTAENNETVEESGSDDEELEIDVAKLQEVASYPIGAPYIFIDNEVYCYGGKTISEVNDYFETFFDINSDDYEELPEDEFPSYSYDYVDKLIYKIKTNNIVKKSLLNERAYNHATEEPDEWRWGTVFYEVGYFDEYTDEEINNRKIGDCAVVHILPGAFNEFHQGPDGRFFFNHVEMMPGYLHPSGREWRLSDFTERFNDENEIAKCIESGYKNNLPNEWLKNLYGESVEEYNTVNFNGYKIVYSDANYQWAGPSEEGDYVNVEIKCSYIPDIVKPTEAESLKTFPTTDLFLTFDMHTGKLIWYDTPDYKYPMHFTLSQYGLFDEE